MIVHSRRDLGSGLFLTLAGVAIANYALTHYDLGQLSRIGGGAFPAAVGILLALLGAMIAVLAWFKASPPSDAAPLRPIVMVIGSIAVFALLVDWAGLLPAVVVLVAGSILADNQHTWRSGLILTAFAAAAVWIIFGLVLGLSFTLARWPL